MNFIKPSRGNCTVDVLDLGVTRMVEACIYDSDRPITMRLLLKNSHCCFYTSTTKQSISSRCY